MLFVLVMECFSAMIKLADLSDLFSRLHPHSIKQWVSLYADDLVIFVSPIVTSSARLRGLLQILIKERLFGSVAMRIS
jgi:hypothetical protein